jgi:hypothetical protein
MTATLATTDGNPDNFVTNTLYFDDGEADTLPAIEVELLQFYNTYVSALLSEDIAASGHTWTWYKMSDPPPRAPVRETPWVFSNAPADDGMPSEVALVLSFQADKVSGLPQARRRGRIYIGPIRTAPNVDGRPTAGIMNVLATGAAAMLLESNNNGVWTWAVYSTVNQTAVNVTNGWIDNSWDTQRRRGLERTARTTFGN